MQRGTFSTRDGIPDRGEVGTACNMVYRMKKQWPDDWSGEEVDAWITFFTDPAANYGYADILHQLTRYTRENGPDRRPRMHEVAAMMRDEQPTRTDELPSTDHHREVIAKLREDLHLIGRRLNGEKPEPPPKPVCESCGLPFLDGSPLIQRGYCADCDF